MNVKVFNQEGVEVGSVELKPEVFGIEPNEAVVHQYVVTYLANQRQGTHQTKTRKEVSGGGRKPFRQKGTGQARMGTIRSPLRRGGGTVFGPHPRDYSAKIPRQMKRLAIQSAFSDKARKEAIKVLDKLEMSEAKTKALVGVLTKLAVAGKKCIILDEGKNETVKLSCRNLPKVVYQHAALANGYDLLNADYIIFTKAGLAKVEEVFA